MQQIVVDTDLGVDDAAAVAWLCIQTVRVVELIGVSAVWGNASVEHVFANVRALRRFGVGADVRSRGLLSSDRAGASRVDVARTWPVDCRRTCGWFWPVARISTHFRRPV